MANIQNYFFFICGRIIPFLSDLIQIGLILLFLGCTGAICLAMLMIQINLSQVIYSNLILNFKHNLNFFLAKYGNGCSCAS